MTQGKEAVELTSSGLIDNTREGHLLRCAGLYRDIMEKPGQDSLGEPLEPSLALTGTPEIFVEYKPAGNYNKSFFTC